MADSRKDMVIIGAGGLGKEVAQLIKDINQDKKKWNLLGYVDETVEKQGSIINDSPVLGNRAEDTVVWHLALPGVYVKYGVWCQRHRPQYFSKSAV